MDQTATIDREKTLVEKFRAAQLLVEDLDIKKKAAMDELNKVENELMEMLEDEGKKSSAKFEGLGHVTIVKPTLWASIQKENQEVAFDFLRSVGREDMIRQTVHSGTLSSFVREMVGEGKTPPPCITYYLEKHLLFTPIKK